MTWDEMYLAVNDASRQLDRLDLVSARLAVMLTGRLRKASSESCRRLKKELRAFNMTTGRWDS